MSQSIFFRKDRALTFLEKADIVLIPAEKESMEVADFGLGELERTGLELVVYVNTDRYCAKELFFSPTRLAPSTGTHQLVKIHNLISQLDK